jgi:uncharacterized membrane protein
MKLLREFLVSTIVGGLLVLLPAYIAVLLLLKGVQTLFALVQPLAVLLPAAAPAKGLLSLLLLLGVCFAVGLLVRLPAGRALRDRVQARLFARLPGYALVRSLTQRVVGRGEDGAWVPALVEIEDALVPAFVIEEIDDGRCTVFVPSVPTPLAGAVYILERSRVHPLDVPFTVAMQSISRWGSGSKDLVAAMRRGAAAAGEARARRL